MKIKTILAVVVTAITIVSCNDARKSETYRLLEDVESYMWNRPDSALQIVTSIGQSDLTTKELKAKHDLFKWYLVMKATNETPEASLLLNAYDCFTSKGPSSERFLSYLFKGIDYMLSKDYESAMKELVKAEEDSEYASTYLLGILHSYKAVIHKSYYDYPATISENILAAEKFLEVGSMRQYMIMIEDIADCYIMNDDIANASKYLDIGEQFLQHGTPLNIHYFYISKAKVISRRDGVDACADFLDQYLEENTEASWFLWRIMANMYNSAGMYDKALTCIEKEALYNDITLDPNYYAVLAMVKKSLMDYKGSTEAYERAMHLDDSLEVIKLNSDTKFIEERYANAVAQIQAEKTKTKLILIILFSLMAAGLTIWRIRIKLQERTAEKKQLEIEKQRYEAMYSEAVIERDALTKMIEENTFNEGTKIIIERRLELLNKVIVSYITDTSAANRKANEELAALVSDRDMFITSTRMTLESSHPAFFRYLREKELTDWEINYCCLYLIGLKGKDIGEYINLKRHYTYGSVIRQKLGLTENDTNLSLYLKKLLENPHA